MKTITRRQFLKHSATAVTLGAMPMSISSGVLGANEEILVGLVGLGGRGQGAHLPGFQNQKGVTVVAVSDPDQERMGSAAALMESRYGRKVEQYADMRQMFDRAEIQVVGNATQNYWHGLSTIWACQAGKHVYVEKPLSHYIWEGRQMVRAARRFGRIVQVGTQHRSEESIIQAIEWIREGHLGQIISITAFANKARSSCGKRQTPLPIPAHVDYDLWCGPARKEPIYRDRLQYDCSFDWNTGDGESCNQGVHEVDVARWCLGEEHLPRRVMSLGGRFLFNDACDVPNTQIIYYDFPTAPLLYEVHNLRRGQHAEAMPSFRGERVGVIVECEGGSVSLYRGRAWDRHGQQVRTFSGGGDHFANFIEAVRRGRREHLHAVLKWAISRRPSATQAISPIESAKSLPSPNSAALWATSHSGRRCTSAWFPTSKPTPLMSIASPSVRGSKSTAPGNVLSIIPRPMSSPAVITGNPLSCRTCRPEDTKVPAQVGSSGVGPGAYNNLPHS